MRTLRRPSLISKLMANFCRSTIESIVCLGHRTWPRWLKQLKEILEPLKKSQPHPEKPQLPMSHSVFHPALRRYWSLRTQTIKMRNSFLQELWPRAVCIFFTAAFTNLLRWLGFHYTWNCAKPKYRNRKLVMDTPHCLHLTRRFFFMLLSEKCHETLFSPSLFS